MRKKKIMKKILTLWFLFFFLLSPLASRLTASTGCNYPSSLDSWSDKVAGDFWTVADVNQARCAIEKLESTVRPTQYGGTGADFSATAQGNILYFSSAGVLSALPPGTSGQFLKTNGAAANPSWADAGRIVLKTADETVNNSSTFQNDDELSFSAASSSRYFVEAFLLTSDAANNLADWKFRYTGPAGMTAKLGVSGDSTTAGGTWGNVGTASAAPTLADEAGQVAMGSTGLTANQGIIIYAIITTAGTAGTINFQWAQFSAQVSDSKVLTGSFLRITKLS